MISQALFYIIELKINLSYLIALFWTINKVFEQRCKIIHMKEKTSTIQVMIYLLSKLCKN